MLFQKGERGEEDCLAGGGRIDVTTGVLPRSHSEVLNSSQVLSPGSRFSNIRAKQIIGDGLRTRRRQVSNRLSESQAQEDR